MPSLPRRVPALVRDISEYVPDLPADDWLAIRDFVVGAARDAIPQVPYPETAVMNAIAHHVDWCVNVAGYTLSRETVFRRDVIGAAATIMPTTHSSTRGRRRSLMLRVGEVLGIIPLATPMVPLAAASPSTPYTPPEVYEVVRWAQNQREERRASSRALVALGLGAGSPSREICTARSGDVTADGIAVMLTGRAVPVQGEWQDELAQLAASAPRPETPLFRPGVAWHKNMVTNFVATSIPDGLPPTVQRMRATWLVEHLAAGTPMQDLLAAAGLKSMDALVRYEAFLPPPSPIAPAGMS